MLEGADIIHLFGKWKALLFDALEQGEACLLLVAAAVDYLLYFVAAFLEVGVLTRQFLIGRLETVDPVCVFFVGFELLSRAQLLETIVRRNRSLYLL